MEVWVASYQHEYGTDLCAFSSEEKAWAWADRIARAWWDHELDIPMPDKDIGKTYFRLMLDNPDPEYFEVQMSEVDSMLTNDKED